MEDSDDRETSYVVIRVTVPRTSDYYLSKQTDEMVDFLGCYGDVSILEEVYDDSAVTSA